MKKRSMATLVLATAFVGTGCTMVDTTEHCVLTRYGKVVNEKMGSGLAFTPFTDATCFSMTEQNFPENDGAAETMEAQTSDPVTITGDASIVFSYDPATIGKVFLEKRSEDAVKTEIRNAIREGYRNAMAGWSVAEIFSDRRASLGDSVKAHVQRKLGNRAVVRQVFIRDIKIPAVIEAARIEAAKQAQVLDRARQQFGIDSVNSASKVMQAEADAKSATLTAQAYSTNSKLLDLEIAKVMAEGMKGICKGVTTCVVGGSVADTWKKQ